MSFVDQLVNFLDSLQGSGGLDGLLGFCVFVVANVLLVPATVLTLVAGFTRGFVQAVLLAALGRVVAGVVSFSLSRSWLRPWLRKSLGQSSRLEALDDALDKGGFRTVVLIRLSPIFPSTVSNYALGMTGLRLRDFALGTIIGTLPSTILYAYLGSGLASVRQAWDGERNWTTWETVLFVAGLVATLAAVLTIGRLARTHKEKRPRKAPRS